MGKPMRLNLKERCFVDAYLGTAAGNGTKAAVQAGYARKSGRVTASRLLTKANIRAAIDARVAMHEAKGIASAEERDAILSRVARDETTDWRDRIAAVKELNKCSGRHSIRHVQDVTETLADIIARSRATK
jgi:phage terminase small subunit